MAETSPELSGPNLADGIPLADLADGGMVVGHADGKPILLVRKGPDLFAIDAQCTHYNGPLGEGIVVDETVRCPWHHACFDLRTGEALHAPALSPVGCWSVEQRGGKIYVGEKLPQPKPRPRGKPADQAPRRIVIVGGGGPGFSAGEILRRVG
jgi:nitrite reductase/ring-hydroxylating ferredoxin subunit